MLSLSHVTSGRWQVYLSVVSLLLFAGCLKQGLSSKGSRGQANGSDVEEIASQPVPISGKNIIASFENSRARCRFTERSGNAHEVLCSVVAVDEKGSESLATEIDSTLSVRWEDPVLLAGAPILENSCVVRDSGLTQVCDVTIGQGPASRVKFDLTLTKTEATQSRTESSIVLLPYSIETFGRVDMIPLNFAAGTKATEGGESVGFQNASLDPLKTILGYTYSTCEMNGVVYVSNWPTIHEWKNGVLRLFAGSTNSSNISEYSHRLRAFLGNPSGGPATGEVIQLACKSGNVYVALYDQQRVLKIDAEGKVHLLAGTGAFGYDGDGGPATAAKLSYPAGITVGNDGSVYFVNQG